MWPTRWPVSMVWVQSPLSAPKREIHVYVDPEKMEAYNLSIETISALVGAENRNIPEVPSTLGTMIPHTACGGRV